MPWLMHYLLCFQLPYSSMMLFYMKDNICRKLTDMDIFAIQQGTMYVKSLLDVADVHKFDYKLSILEEKWNVLNSCCIQT